MANKLLHDDIIRQVKEVFDKQLVNPVEVMFFDSQDNCEHCDDTRQLVEEVIAISDKLHLSSYDLKEHAELAEQYHVSMAPGLVIAAKDDDQITDYGIRFAGIPSGYEFSSLIRSLVLVSGRDSGLAQKLARRWLILNSPFYYKYL